MHKAIGLCYDLLHIYFHSEKKKQFLLLLTQKKKIRNPFCMFYSIDCLPHSIRIVEIMDFYLCSNATTEMNVIDS